MRHLLPIRCRLLLSTALQYRYPHAFLVATRTASSHVASQPQPQASTTTTTSSFLPPASFELDGVSVVPNADWWNLSPLVQRLLTRRPLDEPGNPLWLMKQRIIEHFTTKYRQLAGGAGGFYAERQPLFTVCDREPRLVNVRDNFDSLLVPADHVCRGRSDTYYVNADHCLRTHTSAHQCELLKRGLDNFLVMGDVFRRDAVDATHYPCFHQIEGVRIYSSEELFGPQPKETSNSAGLFNAGEKRTPEKQGELSADATRCLVIKLKATLEDLATALFGTNVEMRWVDSYFPFTHPSFELEVRRAGVDEDWLELLGCGVMEQRLLEASGVGHKVGWAFGIGLERLAMILYGIPDIRLFWSRDSGFLSQFAELQPSDTVTYKPISVFPQLFMDISVWLAAGSTPSKQECPQLMDFEADVRDTIRNIGGDWVEQVKLVDDYWAEKKQRRSHCYRVTYRSMDRVLTKEEVNNVHKQISDQLVERFGVEIR